MTYSHLLEIKRSSREVFKGHFLHAMQDSVSLHDGSTALLRGYVVHPGAVMVTPLLQGTDGAVCVVLERQFRYPVGQVMVDPGRQNGSRGVVVCLRTA